MKPIFSLFIFAVFVFVNPQAWALDLGTVSQGAKETIKAEIVNEEESPVKVSETGASKILEITQSAQLEAQEEYRSPYIDTQTYRTVTIFVVPEKILNEPVPVIRYKIDAFFSPDTGMKEYRKMGDDESKIIGGGGYQEFGMTTQEEEGSAEKPRFVKLTTGETGSRMLSCPAYGPYMRVTLKNFTTGDRRKFRIVAYLNR